MNLLQLVKAKVKMSEGLRAPITHPQGLSIKVFPAFSVRGEGYFGKIKELL